MELSPSDWAGSDCSQQGQQAGNGRPEIKPFLSLGIFG